MKILIGTMNPAKFQDIKETLEQHGFETVGMKEFGIKSIEEIGKTFEENAILKAKTYAKLSGLPAVADDAGLEIEALGGEPGVKSRRGIGDESDEALISSIIQRMEGIKNRNARLSTVVSFALPDERYITSEVCIRGTIALHPTKKRYQGYPYRSLFYVPNMGKCYADFTDEELAEHSHRKKALRRLIKRITKISTMKLTLYPLANSKAIKLVLENRATKRQWGEIALTGEDVLSTLDKILKSAKIDANTIRAIHVQPQLEASLTSCRLAKTVQQALKISLLFKPKNP